MISIGFQDRYWGPVDLLRQTSKYSGVAEEANYIVGNYDDASIDYLIALGPNDSSFKRITKSKRIYIQMENARIWRPSMEMLSEYGIVISPFDLSDIVSTGTKFIRSFPCVPWFYGVEFCTKSGLLHKPLRSQMELDAMAGMAFPKKTKLISMIASGKGGTPGHAWRIDLAIALKKFFGPLIDVYGFGHTPVPDKRIAIDPYAFSIVVENDQSDFYVTEKVVDSLIGWSIPIYSGAHQLDSLLLSDQVPRIPFGCQTEKAISAIKKTISSGGLSPSSLTTLRNNAMRYLNVFDAIPALLKGF